MQLYIDSYGTFLNVKNGMFQVTPKNNEPHRFATNRVSVIFLTEGVSVSADALMLAIEKEIPLVLINYLGQAVGQLWHGKFGSIASIRRNQVYFADHTEGWAWMAQHLAQKIDHQNTTLQYLAETYPQLIDANAQKRLGRTRSTLDGLAKSLKRYVFDSTDFKKIAMDFRAYEATASRHYFRFMASIIPHLHWQFESRSTKPATDFFNCILNYLYGMLYAQTELALIKVGLDPALGILHVDRYNRPTMVYDFIEPFRQWADRIAFELALEDAVPAEAFLQVPQDEDIGYWLSPQAKGIVIRRFLDFLNRPILYQQRQLKRLLVLDLEAQKLATKLKNWK